jgi:hypothetical protein
MQGLSYAPIDDEPSVRGLPPPSPNGGWYTGAACPAGAAYCAVPVQPDAAALHRGLPSPPGVASCQPAAADRPGNSAYDTSAFASLPGLGLRCPR